LKKLELGMNRIQVIE